VSLEKRIEALEGRIEPSEEPEESKWRATRQEYRERLDELARLYHREGETIKDCIAQLQEQGHSYQDAQTIAKHEVLRAKNSELADFYDASYPPEIRHDPIAKREWLTSYLDSRRTRRSSRA
jgi:hypothetical protein